MDKATYILAFYGIVVGLTATTFIKGWGELIRDREKAKNWWPTLLWSAAFFMSLLNEWIIQFDLWQDRETIVDLLGSMLFPFAMYAIGTLIYPELNKQTDYFEYLKKQKQIIFGIALFIIALKYDFTRDLSEYSRTREEVILLILPHAIPIWSKSKIVIGICGIVTLLFWVYRFAGIS